MPPVVIAVAAAAASYGAVGLAGLAAGSLGATLIGSAAALAVSTAGNAIFAKGHGSKQSLPQAARDRTVSVRQPISPRQIVYGNVKVGGTIVFLQSTDNNKYLHMVVALAGHELEEITTVYFDDRALSLDGSGNVTSGAFSGKARVKKHLGTTTQTADTDLVAASGGKWTTAHRGQGVAYLYVRLEWDANVYTSGIPNVTAVVKGKKVYDPRYSTTAYSNNAAICLRDYMLTPVKDGGVGALDAELDATNWIAAANLCDETVPIVGTALTEKRYTLDGTIAQSASNSPKSTLENLLTSCGGTLVYAGGKWRLLPAAYRTPTVTLTEADLRGGIQMTTRVSRREQYNAVKGTFISPDSSWQPTDYPAVVSDTAMAEDGGARVFREVDRPYTTSAAMAQRLGKIDLLRGRQPITIQMPCKLTAFRVQAGDVVNVTNSRFGWTAKPFEVREWQFAVTDDGMLGVDLSLRETAGSIYDWNTSEEQTVDPAPNTALPDWRNVAVPTSVAVTSSNSEVIEGTDGSLISRAVVSWTASADAFVSKYEIQYRIVGETNWTYRTETTGTSHPIDNIPVGIQIDVRVRAVNSLGVASNFVTIFAHTVTGYSTRSNPAVTGLKVVGSAGGSPGVFNTRDVSFVWTPHSIGILFDAYVVEIRNVTTNTLRRTFTTQSPTFLYDLASNSVDGIARTFTVSVQVRTRLGALSTATTLTATNAAPALPTGITLEGDFRTARLRYTPPAEEDWAGIIVWRSTTTGFTPGSGNLVYQGPDTLVVWGADPGVTYYVRYACYDVFGTTGLNVSGESVVATTKIVHADLVTAIIDSTSLYPDLSARIDLIDAPSTGLVTQVSTIASQTATNTAAVSTQATAIGGLEAKYTVKVDVNGYMAGYGIAATANTATPTSDFIVLADRFSIAKPGGGGISPTIPFIVSTVGGTPVLSFEGYAHIDKLMTGTLDTELLYVGENKIILDGPTRAIRVNDGLVDRVRIGKQLDATYGIVIKDASGNTILSSGAGLGAGVVTSASLAAGSGVNLVYNADAQVNTHGWNASNNSTGHTISVGKDADAGNTIPGLGLLYWFITGTATAGQVFDIANTGVSGQRIPVIAGRRYEAYGYCGQYRAASVYVNVRWFDAANAAISEVAGNLVTVTGPFNRLDQLAVSSVFSTAPTGAVTAEITFRVLCNTGSDPYGLVTQAYFGEAGANQTELSRWVPGPSQVALAGVGGVGALAAKSTVTYGTADVTGFGTLAAANNVDWNTTLVNIPSFGGFAYLSSITSANISTYIASAAIGTAYISDLNVSKLTAGDIDATGIYLRNGNVKVWDSNNLRDRVWMGHKPGVDYGFWIYAADGTEILSTSGINGTYINSLTVDRLSIKDDAINGVKIEDLSTSNSASVTYNSSTTYSAVTNHNLMVLNITTLGSRPVFLTISALAGVLYGNGTVFRVYRNGSLISDDIYVVTTDIGGQITPAHWQTVDTPPAGSTQYVIQFQSGTSFQLGKSSLFALETRK